MTTQKLNANLKKIESCISQNFFLEALLRSYHLNLSVIYFLLVSARPDYETTNKKTKQLLKDFGDELSVNAGLKSSINKKTFKLVKTWMKKMDSYHKVLRTNEPTNTKQLLIESQKIFSLLNISLVKMSARKAA